MTVTTEDGGRQNMFAKNRKCMSLKPTQSVMDMRVMQNVRRN